MFHDLITAYADAIHVATTLRPPVSAPPARESERLADDDEHRRAGSSDGLAGRIVGWMRTRLGRGFGAPAAPPVRPPFIRARHP